MVERLPGNAVNDDDGDVRPIDDVYGLPGNTESKEEIYSAAAEAAEAAARQAQHDQAVTEIGEIHHEHGSAVDIGVRAVALREALTEYAAANGRRGFQRSGKYIRSPDGVEASRAAHLKKGNEAFDRAYGEYDSSDAEAERLHISERHYFNEIYLEPGSERVRKRREKYKKRLESIERDQKNPPEPPEWPWQTHLL